MTLKSKIYYFLLITALVAAASGMSFLFGTYYQEKVEAQRVAALLKNGEVLRTENDIYKKELSEIKLQLSKMKILEDKLVDIFGLKTAGGTKKDQPKKKGLGGPEISQRTERLLRKGLLSGDDFYHKDAGKIYTNIQHKEDVFSEIYEFVSLRKTNTRRPLFVYTMMPVKGKLNSNYGTRIDPITENVAFHEGVDIAADYWSPVRAIADGKVTYAGLDSYGYGRMVTLNHGKGYETVYGHNCMTIVKENEKVKKGEIIAYVGNSGRSTGPHLHFEVRYNGKAENPLNYYFRKS